MNEFDGPGEELGVKLALAESMAARNIKEMNWGRSVLAETVPVGFQFPLEIMQKVQTGATLIMLDALDNPDVPQDPTALARIMFDDSVIADLLLSFNETPDDKTTDYLRTLIDGLYKTLFEQFFGDDDQQQELKHRVETARAVAEKHSRTIFEVFADDDLYAECVRTMQSPRTYAEGMAAELDKIKQDTSRSFFRGMLEATLRAEETNGEMTPEEYERQRDQIIKDILEDEETLAELEATISAVQQANQRLILRGIERFWGKQALDELADFLKDFTANEDGDIVLPAILSDQQRNNDKIAVACMEKGWDPDNLTVEQAREINLLFE